MKDVATGCLFAAITMLVLVGITGAALIGGCVMVLNSTPRTSAQNPNRLTFTDEVEAKLVVMKAVRPALKDPGTAKFTLFVVKKDSTIAVSGTVVAQNSFGARLPSQIQALVKRDGGVYSVEYLRLDGKSIK